MARTKQSGRARTRAEVADLARAQAESRRRLAVLLARQNPPPVPVAAAPPQHEQAPPVMAAPPLQLPGDGAAEVQRQPEPEPALVLPVPVPALVLPVPVETAAAAAPVEQEPSDVAQELSDVVTAALVPLRVDLEVNQDALEQVQEDHGNLRAMIGLYTVVVANRLAALPSSEDPDDVSATNFEEPLSVNDTLIVRIAELAAKVRDGRAALGV